jgi:hypothetical protein
VNYPWILLQNELCSQAAQSEDKDSFSNSWTVNKVALALEWLSLTKEEEVCPQFRIFARLLHDVDRLNKACNQGTERCAWWTEYRHNSPGSILRASPRKWYGPVVLCSSLDLPRLSPWTRDPQSVAWTKLQQHGFPKISSKSMFSALPYVLKSSPSGSLQTPHRSINKLYLRLRSRKLRLNFSRQTRNS